jgi:dienelactone hydrolase
MPENTTSFPVLFPSGATTLAGRVHRRADSLTERQPAVLVSGSWLTVKEQMADLYAAALAERGFTAITFDFAGWGQSGGVPGHVEQPSRKIADIIAVANFVSTWSLVRPGPIGYLGVCATSQYALTAIGHGARVGSFASVAGWFHDMAKVMPFYGGAAGLQMRLERAEAAAHRYLRTGEVVTVSAYDAGNDRAAMFVGMDYYANPARGAVTEWRNEMAEMSWLPWLTFDGLSAAAEISVPCLFVHSDGCVFPESIETLRHRLRRPVEVVWSEGAQTDFYDQPVQVAFAVDAVGRHFTTTLGAPEAVPA